MGAVSLGGVLSACASQAGRAASTPSVSRTPSSRTDELLRKYRTPRPRSTSVTPTEPVVGASRRHTASDDAWTPTDAEVPTGVLPRSSWARAAPIPRNMNRMAPVRRITFHHDGMSVFRETQERAVAERLELIRSAHVNRRPAFGDIGYHYVIDPTGRVWQGRPLTWQGAHVSGQNEGNLGICILGNYEHQQPNAAQERAIAAFLRTQMTRYRVSVDRVSTHRELAATLCPGRYLQPRLAAIRAAAGRVRVG